MKRKEIVFKLKIHQLESDMCSELAMSKVRAHFCSQYHHTCLLVGVLHGWDCGVPYQ